jgi:hypothetical protein
MFFGQASWHLSEIPLHISDMNMPASGLKAAILDRAAMPGSVWTPSDFLDLGGRDAVDKTLQRLSKSGELRRIDRGLYDKPAHNELTHQANPPSPKAVIDAVARRDQIRVLVDGMTAANDLGFTNAVPAKVIVHAETRLKAIKLGNMPIIFKSTAASKLFWAGRPAMRIVQALHWLRDTMSGDENDQWRDRLVQLLSDPVHGAILRADLADGMASLPVWMQELLRPLVVRPESDE